MSQTDDFGLSAFDEELKPSEGFSNKLEDLPNGDYEFLITKTVLTKTPSAGKNIFRMTLRVESGQYAGVTGEKTAFLVSQEAVNIFAGELKKLGFDTDQWDAKKKRPFSAEFFKIKDTITGLTFKGSKRSTVAQDGKRYTNIDVKELLGRREVAAEAAGGAKSDPSDPF